MACARGRKNRAEHGMRATESAHVQAMRVTAGDAAGAAAAAAGCGDDWLPAEEVQKPLD